LDVPLLAGFGFKVLSRSANELIIITIIFTVTQKKKCLAKRIKKGILFYHFSWNEKSSRKV
jgi:hypothetical protein